jgi:valyl-tRNA synthetase
VAKEEPIRHNVGHSERTDAIIEPRLTHQWFLNMKEMASVALQAVERGEVTLIPDRYLNTYRHWLENVQDWNISRQLWWGQQIPAWFFDTPQGTQHVVARTEAEALPLAQAKGYTGTADGLTQDPDVLDTWFSSWLWPMAVFDPTVFRPQADGTYPRGNADLQYYYPTNDLVTAPEILFFWVARMIMAGKTWDAQGRAPFRNVYLTGIVRDKQRRKMSKSLGNSPDPLDLIRDYGADSVRVGMLLCAPAGNDILFDMTLVEQGRNFCNKLWNSFRLLKTLEASQDAGRPANAIESQAMRWMQARISEVSRELTHLYSQFRISEALMAVYKLVWDDFCSWYLEMIKPTAGGSISAHAMEDTRVLFEEILKLLHPFTPFITEELWHQLRPRAAKDSLMIALLREPAVLDTDAATLAQMQEVRELITAIRALRAENGLGGKELLTLQVHSQAPQLFDHYAGLICRFAALSDIVLVTDRQEGMATTLVRAHTLYLPKGAVDAEEARAKLQAEIAYTEGFLKSVRQKLGNEKFVANAKPDVVANERKKQADAEAKLAALQQQLASLG